MDPHTESVAEAPAEAEAPQESSNLEALPDAGEDSMTFESSLEKAFSKLDAIPSGDFDGGDVEPAPESAPEPAPPAEAAEPLEALSEDIGDDWTPKAASRFKQLKAELKNSTSELESLRHQRTEHESKIQELTGLTENKDIEQLQSKLAEYEQQQTLTNLEATESYKEVVTKPLVELMKQAEQLADKYAVDADALVDALTMEDEQQQEEAILDLLPTATDRDKAKLYRIIEDIDPIVERRTQLFEHAGEALAEANAVEEERSKYEAANRAQLRANVTKNVVERVQQKLPFLSGLEDLDMGEIERGASEIDPLALHPVDHAYNAVSAQLLPSVVRQYVSMRKEVELLTDRLAEYESVEPTMSGQTKSTGSLSGVTDEMSFTESINAALGGA